MLIEPSPPPDEPEDGRDDRQALRLWLRLLGCSALVEKMLRSRMASELDTTLPRFDVMSALDRHPEGLVMGDLSALLLVSNGNVTGVADRLQQEGLVERRQLEHDRRSTRVSLTEEGRKRFAAMARRHRQWIGAAFAGLSDDEMLVLTGLLGSVRRSIEHAADAAPKG